MDGLIDCLNDISNVNIIYMVILVAASSSCITTSNELAATHEGLIKSINDLVTLKSIIIMDTDIDNNYNSTHTYMDNNVDQTTIISSSSTAADTSSLLMGGDQQPARNAGLLVRIFRRFVSLSDTFIVYAQNQFNEHTATSIASCSVLIILISIICCFIISLMREEERKIKEQYKKLNTGSSSSFLAVGQHGGKTYHNSNNTAGSTLMNYHHPAAALLDGDFVRISAARDRSGSTNNYNYSPLPPRNEMFSKLHVIELRRETYFGLVRLSKPGCRTIVLLCDQQSKVKLLAKFYQCIYPYRKNKVLMFAFLLIEKNIGWYEDLLKLALNEKRDLHINPINCIGTVLILNGFKKWFSVYHESDSRCDPDEPFVLLEESLLDNLPSWLERSLAGRASRFQVRYWPHQMK